MPQSAKKIAAWLEAHPQMKDVIPEDVLATCGPWPSLEASDFLVYAREREEYPREAVKLVEELWRECLWAYDGWAKALAMDAQFMIRDMLANCSGADAYNFTRQFLTDYAKAHGMVAETPKEEAPPPWRQQTPNPYADSGGVPPPMPKARARKKNA